MRACCDIGERERVEDGLQGLLKDMRIFGGGDDPKIRFEFFGDGEFLISGSFEYERTVLLKAAD